MSNPNCTYIGKDLALHPPTTQTACSAPNGGNNSAILENCCGGATVAQYRGLLNGDAGSCLQYCNLSSTVTITSAQSCLAGRGVCYNATQPRSSSGSRKESAGYLRLGYAFAAFFIAGLAVENAI